MDLSGLYQQVGNLPRQIGQDIQQNQLLNAQLASQAGQDRRAQAAFDMEQQQAAQQAAQQQQYNALLSQYLGPEQAALAGGAPVDSGPQQGNALLSQLYQMDPQRTSQLIQFQQQQQQAAQEQQKQEAMQVINAAQFVLQSERPKWLLENVYPQFLPELEKQGVDVEAMDDAGVHDLAERLIAHYSPMAGLGPQKTDGGENPFAKVNPENFTSESIKKFRLSGNYEDLVPREAPDADAGDRAFQRANVLRDEFNAANRDYNIIESQYGNILATARAPSAAGDISLITSYMKMLDPQSTVREGEFANAENAGGVPQKIQSTYNKMLNGERLAAAQRADFVKQAAAIFAERQKQADKNRDRYTTLAERAGIDPIDVVGGAVADDSADIDAILDKYR